MGNTFEKLQRNPSEAEVTGRMLIGMGSESLLETLVILNRTYDVPCIPQVLSRDRLRVTRASVTNGGVVE